METLRLKKFTQFARRVLPQQVSIMLERALAEGSDARKEKPEATKALEAEIKLHGKNRIVEHTAYTWFNRFCILRIMDVQGQNRIKIVSPADPGKFRVEILEEARAGRIDQNMVGDEVRQQVFNILGEEDYIDQWTKAYRLLLLAACNYWHKTMPLLFQPKDDYTELLMPEDLLSGNSILTYIREALTSGACEDPELFDWLYQCYLSPENYPVVSEIFTQHKRAAAHLISIQPDQKNPGGSRGGPENQQGSYRALEEGERLHEDDEGQQEDGSWRKIGRHFSSCYYDANFMVPMRRKITPKTTKLL